MNINEERINENPYQFLKHYDTKNSSNFFGRDLEIKLLLSDIVVSRLVVLFAKSGCGKTSLLKAGVFPRLEELSYATFYVRVEKDPSEAVWKVLRKYILFDWRKIPEDRNEIERLKDFLRYYYDIDWVAKAKFEKIDENKKIKIFSEKFLFDWDEITEKKNEKLKDFLVQKYHIDWIKSSKMEKIDNGKTIKLFNENNSFFLRLHYEKKIVNLDINETKNKGYIAKIENGILKIYEKKFIILTLNNENKRVNIEIDDCRNDSFFYDIQNYEVYINLLPYLFTWEENDKEKFKQAIQRFIKSSKSNYNGDWISSAKIERIDNDKIILYNEKDSLRFKLNNEKVELEFNNGEIYEFIARKELEGINIYEVKSMEDKLKNIVKILKKPVVIFFDQFEEFFKIDNKQQKEFISDIAKLYRDRDSGVHIVFSMREEFFVNMDIFRDEIPSIFHNNSSLRLLPFNVKQAREAIVKPTEKYLKKFIWDDISGSKKEKFLEFLKNEYVYKFSWDGIPGKDNAKLIEFLKRNFSDIDWIESAKIEKINDISRNDISNKVNAIRVYTEKNYISIELNKQEAKVIVEINNDETREFITGLEKDIQYVYEYGVDWLKSAKIDKTNDGKTITITIGKDSYNLTLNDKESKVDLRINDGEPHEFAAQIENGKLIIYREFYEKSLVDKLLSDLIDLAKDGNGSIQPAHLQIVCHTIWKKRETDRIDLKYYTDELEGASKIMDERLVEGIKEKFNSSLLELFMKLLPKLRNNDNTKNPCKIKDLIRDLNTDAKSLDELLGLLDKEQFINRVFYKNNEFVEWMTDYLAIRTDYLLLRSMLKYAEEKQKESGKEPGRQVPLAKDNLLFYWVDFPGTDKENIIKFLTYDFIIDRGDTPIIEHIDTNRIIISNEQNLFSWDEIPGNDNVRLVDFLKQNLGIDWVITSKVEKIDDDKTIRVSTEGNFLSLKLNNEKTRVNLETDTGKTDEFIVKTENSKLKIYNKNSYSLILNEKKVKAYLEINGVRISEFTAKKEDRKLRIYKTYVEPFLLPEEDFEEISNSVNKNTLSILGEIDEKEAQSFFEAALLYDRHIQLWFDELIKSKKNVWSMLRDQIENSELKNKQHSIRTIRWLVEHSDDKKAFELLTEALHKRDLSSETIKELWQTSYCFTWDEIAGNDNGRLKLVEFLNSRYHAGLSESVKIEKSSDDKTIIIFSEIKSISLLKNNEIVELKIGDNTYELTVRKENGRLNIYYSPISSSKAIELLKIALDHEGIAPQAIGKLREIRTTEAVEVLEWILNTREDLSRPAWKSLEIISNQDKDQITKAREILANQSNRIEKIKQQELSVASRIKIDDIWKHILEKIGNEECIPILGPGFSSPGKSDIAKDWSKEYQYPLQNCRDLQNVVQFLSVKYDPDFPKMLMAEKMKTEKEENRNLNVYSILADLPIKIYITTNYDDTLFKALKIERNLFSWENKYLFIWEENPEKDYERLREILNKYYNIDWVKTAKFEPSDDNKTIRVSFEQNYLSLSLNNEKNRVSLIIDDGRVDEFIVKTENNKLNIYEKKVKFNGFKEFIQQNFNFDINAEYGEIDTGNVITISDGDNSFSLRLNDEQDQVILRIEGGRTYNFSAKSVRSNNNNEKIINVYRRKKNPIKIWRQLNQIKDPILDFTPTVEEPAIFYINGYYETPKSLLLTQEDMVKSQEISTVNDIQVLGSMYSWLARIGWVKKEFSKSSFLFLGYSFEDWEFRAIFDNLVRNEISYLTKKNIFVTETGDSPNLNNEKSVSDNFLGMHTINTGTFNGFTDELNKKWNKISEKIPQSEEKPNTQQKVRSDYYSSIRFKPQYYPGNTLISRNRRKFISNDLEKLRDLSYEDQTALLGHRAPGSDYPSTSPPLAEIGEPDDPTREVVDPTNGAAAGDRVRYVQWVDSMYNAPATPYWRSYHAAMNVRGVDIGTGSGRQYVEMRERDLEDYNMRVSETEMTDWGLSGLRGDTAHGHSLRLQEDGTMFDMLDRRRLEGGVIVSDKDQVGVPIDRKVNLGKPMSEADAAKRTTIYRVDNVPFRSDKEVIKHVQIIWERRTKSGFIL